MFVLFLQPLFSSLAPTLLAELDFFSFALRCSLGLSGLVRIFCSWGLFFAIGRRRPLSHYCLPFLYFRPLYRTCTRGTHTHTHTDSGIGPASLSPYPHHMLPLNLLTLNLLMLMLPPLLPPLPLLLPLSLSPISPSSSSHGHRQNKPSFSPSHLLPGPGHPRACPPTGRRATCCCSPTSLGVRTLC